MNKRLYVDLHVLQTVPPAVSIGMIRKSENRSVRWGSRARVSSQAWKRHANHVS